MISGSLQLARPLAWSRPREGVRGQTGGGPRLDSGHDGAAAQARRRWWRIRALRLAVLSDAPYAFGSSFAREVEYPPERWDALAEQSESGERGVVFAPGRAGQGLDSPV